MTTHLVTPHTMAAASMIGHDAVLTCVLASDERLTSHLQEWAVLHALSRWLRGHRQATDQTDVCEEPAGCREHLWRSLAQYVLDAMWEGTDCG